MNLYTIYDWITSLLRTHNGSVSYKAIEASEDNAAATSVAASPTTATAAAATSLATTTAATANGIRSSCVQNVEVEFVPTLTFLFEKPIPPEAILETEKDVNAQTEHSPSEGLQHEASSNNVDNVDSDSDNDSTHTYIISRSSWTTTTATSSSTPYAVTSTDTSELLRQQNNLSLTEEEETVSSYSIEPPTSSMTIDMAEPQTSIATTRSEATSSVDVVATTTTATTTTTTTSSSIEEDIEEAIEISEVEEQLESLSEAAAYARPKQQEQSAKSLSKSSEESDAEEFRIDDSQLSGGQLAQHFIVVNETEDEDDEEEEELELEGDENIEINVTASSDDDFDISLPLEQRNVIHSRHDTDDGEEYIKATKGAEQVDQIDITPEASLSHQSTTHDVSELADEQQQENDEPTQATSQEHDKETDEQDHSLEEIVASNQSIEVTYEPEETTKSSQKLELITDLDAEEEKQIQIIENKTAKALTTLQLQAESLELTMLEVENDDDGDEDDDEEDNSLQLMKLRLMAMNQQQSLLDNAAKLSPTETGEAADRNSSQEIKQMERVPLSNEFSKDVLEDITEESERLMSLLSTTTIEEPSLEESKTLQQPTVAQVGSSSSLVSLNMLKQLEAKVQELSTQLETKDNCVASLNMQLDAARRESSTGPASARDTSSLMTNSTEYRTLQDELGGPTLDIYVEMSRRDETIAKLTESLQHSLNSRNQLQVDANRLADELQDLRRQLHEALETVKRSSTWEPEPNASQRISEISMDLISESEDDLDQHFLTDNEADRASRSSRERQLASVNDLLHPDWTPAFSKQIEQFQTYLLPNEQKVFQMVQRKFDDYLNQQLSLAKEQSAQEMKICRDQWESEKLTNEQTQQAAHAKQMEELRKYFEHKCADLEKQFSDDVFSHKSQHLAGDSSSECSEAEQLPEEGATASRETSPRKRKRAELLLSPSHRQITPCGLDSLGETGQITGTKDGNHNISLEIADLKIFYQTHIHELKRAHEDQVRKLTDRVKFYERRLADDDYKNASKPAPLSNTCDQANNNDNSNDDHVDEVGDGDLAGQQNPNTSLIIIDEDELNFHNESQVIQRIIEEYERRLQEQLALARQDIANELEQQIQNLLSENTVDDQHWPKELILLREKFTAKSQLEITQLNIKHADEMSRLKLEYEKQLNRKNKRHSTFDSGRDLEQVINERDGLRELSKSFRSVLCRLAKCVANCEEDLNATLSEEVQRLLVHSRSQDAGEDLEQTLSSSLNCTASKLRLVPDVHSLLEVVEDPSLLQFIDSKSNEEQSEDFDLNDCLERLKSEASYLLHLSEDLHKQREHPDPVDEPEKQEHELCCEAEDGLKTTAAVALPQQLLSKFLRTNSLNDQYLGVANQRKNSQPDSIKPHSSLPTDLQQQAGNASELAFQLVELKNRLIKSENDRQKLQQQLNHTIDRNAELGQELQALRDQLSQFNSLNHTDYNEGYGLGSMKSNQEQALDQSSASFMALQEKARNLLSSPSKQETRDQGNATVILLQMIEDFCREGDKVVECGKKERDDLQSQIDTADKQLKDTRRFLEDQAAEREQERDEFQREIERLKTQLRDKEKEHSSYANASEEYAQLESQLREVNRQLSESNSKRDKFEVELKASIDKIFVLREIISELETQVQTKALNEQVLDEKAKQLEDYVSHQMRANDALQQEVHSLKTDIGEGYQTRIRQLEDKLQQGRPSAEQSMILNQVAEQLRDIETTLEQKTKALESLHNSNTASNSCSLSATEDVSVHGSKQPPTGEGSSPSHPSLSVEGVQRVAEKLDRHTRVEEAAIKRIRDLEMQVQQTRAVRVELEHERDSLQGRMDEQTHRISTLQTRLEEQRQRAEQLHRAGTSDLHARVHELQGEVQNLSEKLSARDKQMTTLRVQLKRSKDEITNLESELKVRHKPDRCVIERLEGELQQKGSEIHKLKEKIRTEMINRLALPDLMETMLADKNDEIDHLRDQLEAKEKELQAAQDLSQASSPAAAGGAEKHQQDASTKLSARTLSDIGSITEFPEPDVERRAAMRSLNAAPFQLSDAAGSGGNHFLQQTMEISKEAVANLTLRRTDDLSGFTVPHQVNTFENPHYFQGIAAQSSSNMMTPELVPRQINFSNLTEDSKLKTPSMMLILTPELPKPTTPPEVEELHEKLTIMEKEKQQDLDDMTKKLKQMEEQLDKEKNKLVMQERTLKDYRETEEKYRLRIDSLEEKLLETTSQEAAEKENLRKELNCVSAAHAQCEHVHRDLVLKRKQEVNSLNSEIKAKAEQLQAATERCRDLELHVQTLERDLERLKNSEHSSKQYSVDEIAQQVEKELNYSAQLDSNILKAIESEEENNLDKRQQQKEVQTEEEQQPGTGHGSEDENFTGERELLNQLEAVRAQLAVEREQCESLSKELMGEKQHSQEIQEQDVVIIEAMRKRLETALDAEDELHKQLDMERERCERLQTQLTSLQRAEGRRNSSLLLKSPGESPRKSPRADFEAELGERLRSEIKLLMAQNERERERSADAQRSSEREKQRYEKELQERIAYCERLKQEMEKLARDKDSAEQELEHFNERLTLQASEIESLESRLVTLQEAETRRANTRTRQHQELTKLHAEIHELKGKLLAAESSRDSLEQKITQLRFDVSRSAQREAKLAEALAQANDRLAHSTDDTVPAQFLQKMKEINTLLAENTQENRQMAETVQYLVGERIALQKRCEELGANGNVNELEERCRQLLGRYLRVESHRKALVYQKRYLKLTLESYQASEQMAMQAIAGGQAATVQKRPKKKLFKTVALAIIAIQRIKYIGRIWHTGKRIVSKSVFTITQQKNVPAFNVNAPPSPLPVANPKVPTNSSSSSNTNNIAGRLSYAPVSPPLVTFSTLQPIVLPQDYALQVPSSSLSHNNNNSNSSNNNNNNNNNNNYNESNLPSLAKLDWATTTTPQKQPKRAQPRLH
ncbi:golgin subfamily A member 4 isoform X2 [Drosophila tropicalis]|uniref:golgin subfamily A member 4 isoform X2 n=1 Tax=Drosophila tropicalis TaxID=46794 RepID=UPI0035ABDB7E